MSLAIHRILEVILLDREIVYRSFFIASVFLYIFIGLV